MAVSGLSGAEGGTKLYISNLDYGVSNEDIKGSAEVVYTRRSDAIAAVKRPEFGQGAGSFKQLSGWNHGRSRGLGQSIGTGFVRGRSFRGRGHGRGRSGNSSHGRGRGGKQLVRKTAEDLDKELETYHAGAMDTS